MPLLTAQNKNTPHNAKIMRRPTIVLDKTGKDRYNVTHVGMWLSLVERIVRDDEAAGSNPVIPTIS